MTMQETEQQLAELARVVPQLLKQNPGAAFWVEFLERADAIRDHVPFDHYDWVTERIYETLAAHGISTPSRWILAAADIDSSLSIPSR
ncbi:hypothetical protein [Dyella flagellata]|uniref:Uncharacterized protein n=1 Tax=Dyella flagellata TaxID=1867833 RepID=A0ABQ5X921_9GAMM|nr:hypothetical protein [Dyella flagellata]GLQ88166.1 hypothetical protein GCM10007898_17350 [Dyella flagellata]